MCRGPRWVSDPAESARAKAQVDVEHYVDPASLDAAEDLPHPGMLMLQHGAVYAPLRLVSWRSTCLTWKDEQPKEVAKVTLEAEAALDTKDPDGAGSSLN